MKRLARQLAVGQQDAGQEIIALDDRRRGEIAHAALGRGAIGRVAAVAGEQGQEADRGNVLVLRLHRRQRHPVAVGSRRRDEEAAGARLDEAGEDGVGGAPRLGQPAAVRRRAIEVEEGARHGQAVAEERSRRIGVAMVEQPVVPAAPGHGPACRRDGAIERRVLAGGVAIGGERADRPAVLAGIAMRVDARQAAPAPLDVGQREIVVAADGRAQIGILAGVEGAVRGRQERRQVAIDRIRGGAVGRIVPGGEGERVEPEAGALHPDDLLELR